VSSFLVNKSYEGILMKFCGEVGPGTERNRLDFGGDMDTFGDPIILDYFPGFFTISRWGIKLN